MILFFLHEFISQTLVMVIEQLSFLYPLLLVTSFYFFDISIIMITIHILSSILDLSHFQLHVIKPTTSSLWFEQWFCVVFAAAELQSLKSHWQDTPPSWDQTEDPCGAPWVGVTCNNSRITSLSVLNPSSWSVTNYYSPCLKIDQEQDHSDHQ